MTTAEILTRLHGVRRSGSGWTAHCPVHDDRHPSLTISVGRNGGTVMRCHANPDGRCTIAAITQAIGITVADLFPDSPRPPKGSVGAPPRWKAPEGRLAATYRYRDAGGELLFEKLRYETSDGKTFSVRRPNPLGGWIGNLQGVPPVPYRLPELREAIARGALIFIVEGEKCVECLRDVGRTATCNAFGADKWDPALTPYFQGAAVAILPDHDLVGRRHALRVARELLGTVKSIRVVPLPDLPSKGDVVDWFAAGRTPAELDTIVARTPELFATREVPHADVP